MTKTEKEFDVGYQVGVKSAGLLEKKIKNPNHNHMAGLVSSILNLLYFYAPKEEYADELLEFAINFAKEEVKEMKETM
jgi:hypothetical protein